jgi:exopolysaccharide production protein ExoZ
MNVDREVAVATLGSFGLIRTLGYGLSSFLIVAGALGLEPQAPGRPGPVRRAALAIGNASFAIYLTHNLVLQALSMATRRVAPSPLSTTIIVAGAMIVVVLVGHVAHRLVETPLIRFFERRTIPLLLGHAPSRLSLAAQKDG